MLKKLAVLLIIVMIFINSGSIYVLAVSYNVTTYTELQTRVSAAMTTDIIILTSDITNGSAQLNINGNKTLDLNGKNLTIITSGSSTNADCIKLNSGAILTIMDSKPGTNKLIATSNYYYYSSASGSGINTSGGTLIIESGTIEAKGSYDAAGIGKGGSIIINGGNVTAQGGGGDAVGGAGIGGASSGSSGGNITINGGNVTATGHPFAAGIGSGGRWGRAWYVEINGGTVVANGGHNASGIGGGSGSEPGYVYINGGNVTAAGGSAGAGIGGCYNTTGGLVNIQGGNVIAKGGDYGSCGIGGDKIDVSISGGSVTAIKGTDNTSNLERNLDIYSTSGIQILGGSVKADTFPAGFPKNNSSRLYPLNISCDDGVDDNSDISLGSYIVPARHSSDDDTSYCWLPVGYSDLTAKIFGEKITASLTVVPNNLNIFEIKNISLDPNYKVYGFQNATGANFCVKRIAEGVKSVNLHIAVYDDRKLTGLVSKNVNCRQNEPIVFSNIFPLGGTSSKIMLWECDSMQPLINVL